MWGQVALGLMPVCWAAPAHTWHLGCGLSVGHITAHTWRLGCLPEAGHFQGTRGVWLALRVSLACTPLGDTWPLGHGTGLRENGSDIRTHNQ